MSVIEFHHGGPGGAAAFGSPPADADADELDMPSPLEPSTAAKKAATSLFCKSAYIHSTKMTEYDGAYGGWDESAIGELRDRCVAFQEGVCKAAAYAWERKEIMYKDSAILRQFAPGMIPAKFVPTSTEPVFTHLLEHDHQTGEFPETQATGFTVFANAQTAFPAAGSGVSSSGSLFHLLVVPNERIYNTVTLNKTHLDLVREMIAFFRQDNMAEFASRVEHCVAACRKMHAAKVNDTKGKDHWVSVYDDMWSRFTADPNWANKLKLGMFFHVHNERAGAGDHSVGHLHMHVFPMNDELRTNYEHDHKCCAAETVCQYLQHHWVAPMV